MLRRRILMTKKMIISIFFLSTILNTDVGATIKNLRFSGDHMKTSKDSETILLSGKAEVTQRDNKLVADKILLDQKNNVLVDPDIRR